MELENQLTDWPSSAGATIGVIIGGTIFLQFLSTKYTDLCECYRELIDECRVRRQYEPRHGSLQSEIRMYRRRLTLMHVASTLAAVALFCFLGALASGDLPTVFPSQLSYKLRGTGGVFSGLVLVAAAAAIRTGRDQAGTARNRRSDRQPQQTGPQGLINVVRGVRSAFQFPQRPGLPL